MPRYAVKRSDGGVSILNTIGNVSIEECIAKWTDETKAMVVEIVPIDETDIPIDRTFRNAWKHEGGKFDVHMDHARTIWQHKMRIARQPKLDALDVDYQRADEAKDNAKKTAVAKKKQDLRDVTDHPDIEAATTPDALKAVWPADLLGDEVPEGIPPNTGLVLPSGRLK